MSTTSTVSSISTTLSSTSFATVNATITITATPTVTTTMATTTTATVSTTSVTAFILNTTMTTASGLTSTIATNNNSDYEKCLLKYSASTCRLAEFIRVLAYLFMFVSFLPQIAYLMKNGSKYVSGVSYIWIIIRALGLISLAVAHSFKWPSIIELFALVTTLAVFIQIFIYDDSLHRQQKFKMLASGLLTWFIGGSVVLLLRKQEAFLTIVGSLLLSVHMLPQILLNSLLRTAKSLAKFSILFLAMSDTLLFASYYTYKSSYTKLIASYYAFSFYLFIYLQSIMYADAHIQVISRSEHRVLAHGIDISSELDTNGVRSSGQDAQMFSIDDTEIAEGTDVVYQPVTESRSSHPMNQQSPMKHIVLYATLGSIAGIEIVLTIMLILGAWNAWIILVPISIPAVVGVFYLLRTRLSTLQTEQLKRIL